MSEARVLTRAGKTITLRAETLDALQAGLRGRLALPGGPGYDEARTVWNAMIDRHPGLVVRCAGAADVRRAVALAAEHDLVLAVRGGGHNIAGKGVCEGGLLIDLSPMRSVRVDPAARTAWVEPGATLSDVDRETQAYGLATPLGINSTTGLAGLTLGGGFGWLSRELGLTIDHLRSADVVTATGELVRASEKDNADLFWALRGGGGNFGVVTAFELALHPVGPQVLSGLVVHPLEDAREVLRFYRGFVGGTPEKFTCWFVLRQAPPLPFLAPEWHGKGILALAMFWSGDFAEGERVAGPLRAFGKPIADVVSPHEYTVWQTALDPLLTPGQRNYWKTHDFHEISEGLIDVLVDAARRIPDPQTEIACAMLGGAVSRVPASATAYHHRDGAWVMNVHGRWADPARDEAVIRWARDLYRAAEPFATGSAYVNFLTEEEQDRLPAAYGGNLVRLRAVKRRWDPTNLFRTNQNIRPAG